MVSKYFLRDMLIKKLYREKLGRAKRRFTVPVIAETDIGKVIEKPQKPREESSGAWG
jgi:hypothetical protein